MKKFAVVAFVFGLVGVAAAADPTGTWKWTSKFGKNEVERTMKLELKDGKLTGTVTGGGKTPTDTKIEEASYKDGELKFNVTTERGGNKITSKYAGKLDEKGETIKMTITTDFNGKENKQEVEAKKVKEEKKKD